MKDTDEDKMVAVNVYTPRHKSALVALRLGSGPSALCHEVKFLVLLLLDQWLNVNVKCRELALMMTHPEKLFNSWWSLGHLMMIALSLSLSSSTHSAGGETDC